MLALLEICGRHGRWVLPIGLLAGLAIPVATLPLRHAIPWCVFLLLCLAVLRLLLAEAALHGRMAWRRFYQSQRTGFWYKVVGVLSLQTGLPLLFFFVATQTGLGSSWIQALVLVAAASPIAGSPHLVQLLGGSGESALGWLVTGTALLPLTSFPILTLLYPMHDSWLILVPVYKLLLLTGTAVAVGFIVWSLVLELNWSISLTVVDGVSSVVLAIMVIGLMSALHDPETTIRMLLATLCFATAINMGMQLLGYGLALWTRQPSEVAVAAGVVCGNRNIALYLAALPATMVDNLLLFIACYQVPMYLTPLVGKRLYMGLKPSQ